MKNHFFLALWTSFIYQIITNLLIVSCSWIWLRKENFLIYWYSQSNGFHDTNTFNTSCSIINFSIWFDGSTFLRAILVSIPIQPNNQKSAWEIFLVQSIKTSTFSRRTFLSLKLSRAQDLINHSNDFLFTTSEHLLRKSSKSLNFHHFSLSFWITSHTSSQIHFTEKNQSLISSQIAATWV